MNPVFKSSLPAILDPMVASVLEQLKEQVEAKDRLIAEKNRALAAAEAINQQLKEALRLERIQKYGKQSEKLSDLQLELLDREPAVSSEEIETEIAGGPLSEEPQEERNQSSAEQQQKKKRKPHPGRNELPAHLERIEEIVRCPVEQCACGECGEQTRVIGYETAELLGDIAHLGRIYSLGLGSHGTMWAAVAPLDQPPGSPGLDRQAGSNDGQDSGVHICDRRAGSSLPGLDWRGQPMTDVGHKVIWFESPK